MANLNVVGTLKATEIFEGNNRVVSQGSSGKSSTEVWQEYSDGTVIGSYILSISSNGAKTYNFPVTFVQPPVVMRTNRGNNDNNVVVRALSVYNITNTGCTFYGYTDDTPVQILFYGKTK